MKTVILDFEYRSDNRHPKNNVLLCVSMRLNPGKERTFRLPEQADQVRDVFNKAMELGYIPVVFYATADLPCLFQLGLTVPRLIDVAVEARMFMLTHPDFYGQKFSLVDCCKAFKVEAVDVEQKESVRDVIINNEHYTEEQWKAIMTYCASDTKDTENLLQAVLKAADKWDITEQQMLNRGEFMIAQCKAYYNTKGFPIDTEFLTLIEDNSKLICDNVSVHCNVQTGFEIYRKTKTGYSFNIAQFTEYLKAHALYDSWQKTEKGKTSLKEEDFKIYCEADNAVDDFASKFKDILMPVYEARNTIKTLNKKSDKYLSNFLYDGHINPPPFPFQQKSSRTSPKPSMGFMLNLQPWLRALIQTKPGHALIGCDWSKQEVVIAGTLSGDANLLGDINGDIYIETTKLLGPKYCPANATKKSHPDLRQKMKGITLGIQYGKGVNSIAVDFQGLFGVDEVEASDMAMDLMDNHKLRYDKYWDWVYETLESSKEERVNGVGCYITLDDWYYFTDCNTRPTQLQNIPMQSNGAAIMRRGFIHCVDSGLDVVCSLHDALYVTCEDDRTQEIVAIMKSCMQQGVKDVLGNEAEIGNEEKVIRSGCHYLDDRGVKMLKNLAEKCEVLRPKINTILAEKRA